VLGVFNRNFGGHITQDHISLLCVYGQLFPNGWVLMAQDLQQSISGVEEVLACSHLPFRYVYAAPIALEVHHDRPPKRLGGGLSQVGDSCAWCAYYERLIHKRRQLQAFWWPCSAQPRTGLTIRCGTRKTTSGALPDFKLVFFKLDMMRRYILFVLV
jgi:hypothetical protein